MKKSYFILFAAIICVSLSAFAQTPKSFIGKWQPITYQMFSKKAVVTIEKQAEQWIISNSLSPGQPILLSYLGKYQMLSGMFGRRQVNITYDAKTDQIIFTPNGFTKPTAFKRIKSN